MEVKASGGKAAPAGEGQQGGEAECHLSGKADGQVKDPRQSQTPNKINKDNS